MSESEAQRSSEPSEALRRLVELQAQLVRLTQERIEQLEREQELLAKLQRSLADLAASDRPEASDSSAGTIHEHE